MPTHSHLAPPQRPSAALQTVGTHTQRLLIERYAQRDCDCPHPHPLHARVTISTDSRPSTWDFYQVVNLAPCTQAVYGCPDPHPLRTAGSVARRICSLRAEFAEQHLVRHAPPGPLRAAGFAASHEARPPRPTALRGDVPSGNPTSHGSYPRVSRSAWSICWHAPGAPAQS